MRKICGRRIGITNSILYSCGLWMIQKKNHSEASRHRWGMTLKCPSYCAFQANQSPVLSTQQPLSLLDRHSSIHVCYPMIQQLMLTTNDNHHVLSQLSNFLRTGLQHWEENPHHILSPFSGQSFRLLQQPPDNLSLGRRQFSSRHVKGYVEVSWERAWV